MWAESWAADSDRIDGAFETSKNLEFWKLLNVFCTWEPWATFTWTLSPFGFMFGISLRFACSCFFFFWLTPPFIFYRV